MNGTSTVHLKQSYQFGDAEWGPWSGACPDGTAVCSILTLVEPDQGSSWGVDIDDAALTGVEMKCCNI